MKMEVKMKVKTHRLRKGFTLIELLVVIAIIALLAAILFPVFARARENARRSSCQSNLKQIALGIKQYTQDYDEKFPCRYTGSTALGYIGWASLAQAYMKSEQIFQCPSETTPPGGFTSATAVDYYYNYSLGASYLPPPTYELVDGVKESAVNFPSNTILNADSDTGYDRVSHFTAPGGNGGTPSAEIAASKRHLEGANYSFVDGHVKWLRPEVIGYGYFDPSSTCGAGDKSKSPPNTSATLCIN